MKNLLTMIFLVMSFGMNAQQDSIIPIPEEEMVPDQYAPEEEEQIFTIVQEMPVFPGGQAQMMMFIGSNLDYSDEAKEAGAQGVVYVQFIINKDGCIDSNINVLRGVHPALDEEAIRIVKLMPCWTPGYQRGVPVRVYYNLPISFRMR
jgi:protein TonB